MLLDTVSTLKLNHVWTIDMHIMTIISIYDAAFQGSVSWYNQSLTESHGIQARFDQY